LDHLGTRCGEITAVHASGENHINRIIQDFLLGVENQREKTGHFSSCGTSLKIYPPIPVAFCPVTVANEIPGFPVVKMFKENTPLLVQLVDQKSAS